MPSAQTKVIQREARKIGYLETTNMTDCKLKAMVVLLAGIVGSTVAQAQTPAALIYDPGVGAISFAAGDLKAALRAERLFGELTCRSAIRPRPRNRCASS